jgi:hypothetical protein
MTTQQGVSRTEGHDPRKLVPVSVSYRCYSVLGMEGSTDRTARRAAELIDELVVGHRELARAQARCAALMLNFAESSYSAGGEGWW